MSTVSNPATAAREVPDALRGPRAKKDGPAASEGQPDRDALYRQIRDTLAGPGLHDEGIQYELARWVELLETSKEDLREGKRSKDDILQRLEREAGAAVAALLSDKPELVFARSLRVQAENGLLRHDGWMMRQLLRGTDGSPVLTVCLGAFFAFFLGIGTHFAWAGLQEFAAASALVPFPPAHTSAVAGAAFLGGLVSILSRLTAFSRLGDFDHVFLFLNALFKPFIGVIFGLFAYAFWQSGLLPLDKAVLQPDLVPYQLWTISFIAGFSERFANDLISRGEGMLPSRKKS
jgi:hypothetical protein